MRPAKQDKASDAPAAKAATPEKGEPEKAAGKSGAQKPAKAGDAPKQAARPLRYTVQVLASAQTVPTSSARFKSYRNKVKQYTSEGRFRYKYWRPASTIPVRRPETAGRSAQGFPRRLRRELPGYANCEIKTSEI